MPNNDLRDESPEPSPPQMTSAPDEKERSPWRWMGYGIEFVGVMALFTYAGYHADKKLDTSPWLMITLMAVAFIGMFYLLIKETAQYRK